MDARRLNIGRLMRWTGRIIASIVAVWFVIMLIGSLVDEGSEPITVESGTLVLLGVIAVTGSILSWWKDVPAGILLFIASVGLGIHIGFCAGHNHVFAWVLIGLPCFVAGALMFGSWLVSKRSR